MTDFSQKQWRISGRKIRMGSQQSNLGIASEGKAGSPHELGKTRRLNHLSERLPSGMHLSHSPRFPHHHHIFSSMMA
jgi:hypothetical protein